MEPLRIALLTSHRLPAAEQILADPNRGILWELSLLAESELSLDELARAEPQFIFVFGYEYELPPAVIDEFRGKIFAINGADSVFGAILSGESQTRSYMHLISEDGSRGPLFLLGPPYPLAPMALDARERADDAFLTTYAELHQRWMISTSWAAMLARAFELLAAGTSQIIGNVVWIDGVPGPCRMGYSPDACHDPETMVTRGIPRSCPFID